MNTEHAPYCDMGCPNGTCPLHECRECGEQWPCEVTRLRATIARVKAVAEDYEHAYNLGQIITHRVAARDVRAALDGSES